MRIQAQKMPDKPVSFVGNAALVLTVILVGFAASVGAVAIYDVLVDACSAGACP